MSNDHYVPQLVLRNFSNRITKFIVDKNGCCSFEKKIKSEVITVYDVKKKILLESVSIKDVYASEQFYADEVENKLNKKIESQFGNLFNKKLVNCSCAVEIDRKDLLLIKKFLLISVLRSAKTEEFIKMEKSFYDISEEKIANILKSNEKSVDEIRKIKESIKPPFVEE